MALGFGLFKSGSATLENKLSKFEGILREAIAKKVCVTASYRGGPIHLLEPYALYRSPDFNTLMLSAIRVDGPSSHSHREKLDTFEVAQFSILEMSHQTFTPDPQFAASNAASRSNLVCTVQAA